MKSRMLRFMPVLLLAGLALGGCQTLHGSKKAASPSVQTLDSVKENKYPWGWIRWMMNAELDPTVSQTVGIVQLEAGQCNQLHQHPNCDELIYVICGTVENTLDDQRVVLHAGDILRIPKNTPHKAFNTSKDQVRTVVIYNTGTRQMVALEPPPK